MQSHKTLPEGSFKAKYESQFYRLKKGKKMLYESNREFKEGMRYLIWSRYSRQWYERRLLTGSTTEEDIAYYLNRQMLWLYPEEEHKQEIRDEVEKAKLPYWELMKRRQGEMDWDRIQRERNDGNGFKLRMKLYKEAKNKHRK